MPTPKTKCSCCKTRACQKRKNKRAARDPKVRIAILEGWHVWWDGKYVYLEKPGVPRFRGGKAYSLHRDAMAGAKHLLKHPEELVFAVRDNGALNTLPIGDHYWSLFPNRKYKTHLEWLHYTDDRPGQKTFPFSKPLPTLRPKTGMSKNVLLAKIRKLARECDWNFGRVHSVKYCEEQAAELFRIAKANGWGREAADAEKEGIEKKRNKYAAPDFDKFDISEAYYIYATHAQGHLADTIFKRLAKIGFRPRPSLRTWRDLTPNGRVIFRKLEASQGNLRMF